LERVGSGREGMISRRRLLLLRLLLLLAARSI
jgi:hypothetical protein